MHNFEEIIKKSIQPNTSPELLSLLSVFYQELFLHPKNFSKIQDSLRNLMLYLASQSGKTDANCRTVDFFICEYILSEMHKLNLPQDIKAILEDMGGALHDTIKHPAIAKNFQSTPEQLLERINQLSIRLSF